MKISKSQQMLAYTLETEQGSETYTVYVDDLHAGNFQGFTIACFSIGFGLIGALLYSSTGQQE